MGATTEAARPGLRPGLWAEILALALAYYGVGRLAWLLVPVPGQAVALWPPAGLALGVLLWRGLALWPGITLGAGALALQACLMTRTLPLPRATLIAAALGVGATLEPVLAALSVRRFVELPLRKTRDALTFAALAGPAPAAIGALACNCVLFWGGLLPRQALAMSIGVWWIGDALGALVFAPLVLLLGSPRAYLPWRRRFAVAIPVAAVTALAIWVFVRASHWDEQRAQTVLRQRTDAITASVQRTLTYHLDALRALADFAGNDAHLDPAAFQRVATGAVVRHFAYEALAWAPAPLDRRPVPVALVEPNTAHPALAVGMDLAADPEQSAKLSAARHSGEALALPLSAAPDGRRLWVFVPAPGRNGEQGIQGFFGAALRLDVMIDRAVAEFGREGVAVELREAAAGPRGRVFFRMPASAGPGPFLRLPGGEASLTVADRAFVLAPLVSQAALAGQRSVEVWVVLLAGMLFVALLEGVLLVAASGPLEETFAIPWQEVQSGRRR
jgi:sensor domain CHASE-containing protein